MPTARDEAPEWSGGGSHGIDVDRLRVSMPRELDDVRCHYANLAADAYGPRNAVREMAPSHGHRQMAKRQFVRQRSIRSG